MGLAYWTQQLSNANGNLSAIITAFGNSPEATALYGGLNAYALINAIYQVQFGHGADAMGLYFYANGLATGQFTPVTLVLNIYNGATGSDAVTEQARLAYSDAFTAALSQSPQAAAAYSGTNAVNTLSGVLAGITCPGQGQSAQGNMAATIDLLEGIPVPPAPTGTPDTT